MSRVLVTRPEPGASATARRLRDMGHDPVVLPLTEIVPLAVDVDSAWAAADAVIATSPNAIRLATAALLEPLIDKPIYVVGERTAAIARSRGFKRLRSANGDADALVRLVFANAAPTTRLLYLAGVERRPRLERSLREAGYRIDVAEIYDTKKVSYSTDFLVRTLGGRRVEIALLYSPRAGELLANLLRQEEMHHLFDNTAFFSISRNVANAFGGSEDFQISVAAHPNEQALLELLRPG